MFKRAFLRTSPPCHPKHNTGSSFNVVFIGSHLANEQLLRHSSGPVTVRRLALKPRGFAAWLREYIYHDRSFALVLRWPLTGFGMCLIGFLATGAFLDRAHNKEARNGRLLRGPGLISRWRFNWGTNGDGLRFRIENRRNPVEWLKRGESGCDLVVERDKEAHHIQIAGDTGTGKSTLVRQIVSQIEARGEVAIIFDSDREYIQEFFCEARGDWVLNPKDERCPYWPIGAEADDEAEATPIAMGLFPDDPTLQRFFLTHTRAVFAICSPPTGPQ
ncbi:MAG: type IV secretion system DNA-binding domain-containing protein [Bryobacteraceae bacterium]